ncbi:MAG: epimerase [Gulosibacter sp.]|uniref:epimerase n=1 Tax=Gulosibacter sp. TaxID=2817531 RepID=UPI003F9352B7
MTKTAVLAGASGFIGGVLAAELETEGYRILRIGRTGPDARWGDTDAITRAVDGAELVINLAGKSVNCRYTDANRQELLRSRIDTTRELRQAIANAKTPPPVWFNASTATIYRYAMDLPQTESTGQIGEGFSVDIATNWEAEFFAGELPGVRRVALRMTIVLGDGPATGMLVNLARVGLGGPQLDHPWFSHRRYRGTGSAPSGSGTAPWHDSRGRQMFSWIHIDDVVGAIRFIRDRAELSGPINLAAPQPSNNRILMRELREAVGMPFGMPAPRAVLEPAMWVLRTEPELVLKSRWVLPERLIEAGYEFQHPNLRGAVRDVVGAPARAR